MIYIDNFTSEEIVPFYIGQAKDIQRRYKQHFEEILALNRLSYEEYKNYFYSGSSSYYEGKFKACKIFKYMIENKCTLQDFRITILEEVEEENLNEKNWSIFKDYYLHFSALTNLILFLNSLSSDFQIQK
ncbi:hypothetical protein KEH51_15735 [[Brevibacterium] frigoritolerans]|uniref:GIY-YIG domain-containing protein n=1 Tax=Peribacillus frigoritolerans TaxID=450367 RepID=A0A941FJ29_9BACI|nr:hypothetical protein [Peribacillus frigoritolerans]